jgi:MFS family permease
MPSNPKKPSPHILNLLPFYYGWFIVALSFLANLTAAGIRSAPSVLIHPLEAEFGWSRTEVASAASLNLLLLGLFAPVGGWLIDRIGARRVILGSLSTIAATLATDFALGRGPGYCHGHYARTRR